MGKIEGEEGREGFPKDHADAFGVKWRGASSIPDQEPVRKGASK